MQAPTRNNFTRIQLHAPDGARAEIVPHGGHVLSWTTPDGRERLFLSQVTPFSPGNAIRGGVPVIFPQFARLGPLQPHGFARVTPWRVIDSGRDSMGTATAHLQLADTASTRAVWEGRFKLDLWVRVGGSRLDLTLDITNMDDQPFTFQAALHTYLRVGAIADVVIDGLGGLPYREYGVERAQPDGSLRIEGEVDRIFWGVPGPVTLHDADHTIRVSQDGFTDVVVWNPGPERAEALPDLEPGGYRHMLCIEAAAIGQPIGLAPHATWRGRQWLDALT